MEIEAISLSDSLSETEILPITEGRAEHKSYIHLLQDLFAKISALSIRLNENKHESTDRLKREIRKNSKESSELQAKVGSAALWSGLFGFGCSLLLLSPERESIRGALRWSADQGSRFINDMRANTLQARKGPLDALVGMEQTEYQAKASSQNADSTKQLVDQFGRQVSEMCATAARGG